MTVTPASLVASPEALARSEAVGRAPEDSVTARDRLVAGVYLVLALLGLVVVATAAIGLATG